jgi:hypothetical protein
MKIRVGSLKGGQSFTINKKFLGKTLLKDVEGHLNVKSVFACHTSSSKTFWRKEKVKANERKNNLKTLIPSSQM